MPCLVYYTTHISTCHVLYTTLHISAHGMSCILHYTYQHMACLVYYTTRISTWHVLYTTLHISAHVMSCILHYTYQQMSCLVVYYTTHISTWHVLYTTLQISDMACVVAILLLLTASINYYYFCTYAIQYFDAGVNCTHGGSATASFTDLVTVAPVNSASQAAAISVWNE